MKRILSLLIVLMFVFGSGIMNAGYAAVSIVFEENFENDSYSDKINVSTADGDSVTVENDSLTSSKALKITAKSMETTTVSVDLSEYNITDGNVKISFSLHSMQSDSCVSSLLSPKSSDSYIGKINNSYYGNYNFSGMDYASGNQLMWPSKTKSITVEYNINFTDGKMSGKSTNGSEHTISTSAKSLTELVFSVGGDTTEKIYWIDDIKVTKNLLNVVSSNPENNIMDAPLNNAIILNFNDNLKPSTVVAENFKITKNNEDITDFSVEPILDNQVKLTVNEGMDFGAVYEIWLKKGLESVDEECENILSDTKVLTFKTKFIIDEAFTVSEVYTDSYTPEFIEKDGAEYEYFLKTKDGEYESYLSGTEINKEGQYILKIIATETVSGRKQEKEYSLEIVKSVSPEAHNVSIVEENGVLKGEYTYFDKNGDNQGKTKIEWKRRTKDESEYKTIENAESLSYTLTEKDTDCYIKLCITPVSTVQPYIGKTVETEAYVCPFRPTANNLRIIGTANAGQTLGAEYTFYDENGDEEGGSEINWYCGERKVGSGVSLKITNEMKGENIYYTVMPVSKKEPYNGEVYTSKTIIVSSGSSSGVGGGSVSLGGGSKTTVTPVPQPSTPEKTETAEKTFSDIKGHWAEENIKNALKNGTVKGMTETTFEPDSNITAAQFLALILRTAGTESKDAEGEKWYSEYVEEALKIGIIDDNFEPLLPILREDMAVLTMKLYEYKTKTEAESSEIELVDKNEISEDKLIYVYKAMNAGILNGMSEKEFSAKTMTTRAQSVVITERLAKRFGEVNSNE